MLSKSSVYEAQLLAAQLASNGVVVRAVPLTPLESLVKATMTGELSLALPNAAPDALGDLVHLSSQSRSSDGGVDHDLAQGEAVELISKVVAFNLDTAKNTVNPVCLDVLDRLNQVLQEGASRDIANITIVPDFYREIWNSPILGNLIEPFVEVPPYDIQLVPVVPDQSDEAIAALLVTGIGPLDNDIVDLIANAEPGIAPKVYREVFACTSVNGRGLTQILNSYTGNRDEAMIAFLLARRLVDDVPDGVNVSLADYRIYMARIQAQAGYAINRILANRQREFTSNILLRGFPTGGVEAALKGNSQIYITVNGSVYNNWLSTGGKPEIILGSFVNDGETSPEKLLEGAPRYIAAWNRHIALRAGIVADQKYSRVLSALSGLVAGLINSTEEAPNAPTKAAMLSALHEQLAHVHHSEVDNLAHLVRRLVCKSMYAHTDALAILNTIDRIAVQFPEMEIGEVALFATIQHVVDWVDTLITNG